MRATGEKEEILCLDRTMLYKSSAVAEMGDRGHNRHGPKIGEGAPLPFWGGDWVPIYLDRYIKQ